MRINSGMMGRSAEGQVEERKYPQLPQPLQVLTRSSSLKDDIIEWKFLDYEWLFLCDFLLGFYLLIS